MMTALTLLALLAWIYLAAFHGRFWQAGPSLAPSAPTMHPAVAIVVPARDEADGIAESIGSLLAQTYQGPFRVVLVDDNSTDATAAIAPRPARRRAPDGDRGRAPPARLGRQAVGGAPGRGRHRRGTGAAHRRRHRHDPRHLSTLVAQLLSARVDMVSEMVALRCESRAERALIPAFVYFFAMLYPFDRVNDGLRATAAAAGGTVLIRRTALARIAGSKPSAAR